MRIEKDYERWIEFEVEEPIEDGGGVLIFYDTFENQCYEILKLEKEIEKLKKSVSELKIQKLIYRKMKSGYCNLKCSDCRKCFKKPPQYEVKIYDIFGHYKESRYYTTELEAAKCCVAQLRMGMPAPTVWKDGVRLEGY